MIDKYLQPGRFVQSDAEEIVAFAQRTVDAEQDDIHRAIALYQAVRDGVVYDPYDDLGSGECCSARRALLRGRGFCIPKAALLVACARAIGIPARLGFADVRNHLTSPRLFEANGSDTFRWHAFSELYLAGIWVKATPAFDVALCRRAKVVPLQFDGRNDSVFHPYDEHDRKHMEYVLDRGRFADVPYEAIASTWRTHSPGLFDDSYRSGGRSFVEEVQLGA